MLSISNNSYWFTLNLNSSKLIVFWHKMGSPKCAFRDGFIKAYLDTIEGIFLLHITDIFFNMFLGFREDLL